MLRQVSAPPPSRGVKRFARARKKSEWCPPLLPSMASKPYAAPAPLRQGAGKRGAWFGWRAWRPAPAKAPTARRPADAAAGAAGLAAEETARAARAAGAAAAAAAAAFWAADGALQVRCRAPARQASSQCVHA